MQNTEYQMFSYFPGCSLATTAREGNQTLLRSCRGLGVELEELPNWNCCGSSSAHAVNEAASHDLAARNLSLVPPGRNLLVACPRCLLQLSSAQKDLLESREKRVRFEKNWGRPFDPGMKIMHFLQLLDQKGEELVRKSRKRNLNGLAVAPYYGCMLARPANLPMDKSYFNVMERVSGALGAAPVTWSRFSMCCGTFLTVARPDLVGPLVNEIVDDAVQSGAECIVTACAMCHMNLEVRSTGKTKIPIFHFSELLALALGTGSTLDWAHLHLHDPMPLLRTRGLWLGP